MMRILGLAGVLTVTGSVAGAPAGEDDTGKALREALTFHASFDDTADAAFGRGDRRIHTTLTGKPADGKPGLRRDDVSIARGKGKYGDALRFGKKTRSVVFFRALENVDYRKEDWAGTVSLWLSLDPDRDLEPGYCDPIQITDKAWNKSAFFVDFTKDETPRHFRLGVFADHDVWNPRGLEWNAIPESDRPMVTVKKPPFGRDRWTHVVFTFSGFNREGKGAVARLYLDGELQGEITGRRQIFTWDPERANILLGLSYIGLCDDLAIFNRALGEKEIKALHGLPGGVGKLASFREVGTAFVARR